LAIPLDLGALPFFKFREADVVFSIVFDIKEDFPKEPIENIETIFFTPEGSLTKDKLVLGSILTKRE
jgi:hypothetical protein